MAPKKTAPKVRKAFFVCTNGHISHLRRKMAAGRLRQCPVKGCRVVISDARARRTIQDARKLSIKTGGSSDLVQLFRDGVMIRVKGHYEQA